MKGAFAVGEIEVVVVSDGHITFTPHEYYQTTAEAWEPHKRWLEADGKLVVPIGCFLVRSAGTTVLIDTGLGPVHSGPYHGGELISSLAAAGVQPEDIDVVFMTHLHADHCGSAALKQGDEMRPAFPRATYRWTSDEQTYWQGDLPAGTFARRDVFDAVASRFVAARRRDIAGAGGRCDGAARAHAGARRGGAVFGRRAGVHSRRHDDVPGAARGAGVVGAVRRRREAGATDAGGAAAGGGGERGAHRGGALPGADVRAGAFGGGAAVLGVRLAYPQMTRTKDMAKGGTRLVPPFARAPVEGSLLL